MKGANSKETAFGSKNQEFQKIELRKISYSIVSQDRTKQIVNSYVTNPFLDFLLNMLISLIKTCAYADGYIAFLGVRLILVL